MSDKQCRQVDHPNIGYIAYERRHLPNDEVLEFARTVRMMVDGVDVDIHIPNTVEGATMVAKIQEHLKGTVAVESIRFTTNTPRPMLDRVEQERVEAFHIDGVLSVIADEVLRPTGVIVHFPDRMPCSLNDLPLHSIFLAKHDRRWYTLLPLSKDLRIVRSEPDGGVTTDPYDIAHYLAGMSARTPMYGDDWVVFMVKEEGRMVVREIDFQ